MKTNHIKEKIMTTVNALLALALVLVTLPVVLALVFTDENGR